MNEPAGPHGFYDGPVKELAARHLGLIKAIFFLLLVSLPGWFFSWVSIGNVRVDYRRHYEASSYGPARVEVKWEDFHDYQKQLKDEFVGVRVFNYPVSLDVGRNTYYGLLTLAWAFALMGVGLLLYRFYCLVKLLYPHLAFYFTLLVLVPFLNLIVILLLLWGTLRQMRQRGLRVGVFGIDPARFG